MPNRVRNVASANVQIPSRLQRGLPGPQRCHLVQHWPHPPVSPGHSAPSLLPKSQAAQTDWVLEIADVNTGAFTVTDPPTTKTKYSTFFI